MLPPRPDNIHKGLRGRLLIIGGYAVQPRPESKAHARFGLSLQPDFQVNYTGAPALAALGALRTGSGVVTLLSYSDICNACAARHPEVVYQPLNEPDQWIKAALHDAELYGAAAVGMGLGRSKEAMLFAIEMWQKWPKPLIMDGDGLYALSVVNDNLNPRADAVITPHEGEAAKLLNKSVEFVRENRADCVKILAEKWGCAVLKGHHSLVASREDNNIYKIPYGGAELSIPGSGDVLAGCIGALLSSGMRPLEAAVLGAAVHGMAGDILNKKYGVDGILSSEIADTLKIAVNDLRKLKNNKKTARLSTLKRISTQCVSPLKCVSTLRRESAAHCAEMRRTALSQARPARQRDTLCRRLRTINKIGRDEA